ncbi:hypothetical protein DY000_02063330 [Brassica cretica]|uniref:Uncharacterized protein n=1 Tax=Brassica cretica TaxID=69181 RepID=A0ABQ7ARV7_BRACR|nr:hypothetical protein DY000_02063330 [Brassica cretica]
MTKAPTTSNSIESLLHLRSPRLWRWIRRRTTSWVSYFLGLSMAVKANESATRVDDSDLTGVVDDDSGMTQENDERMNVFEKTERSVGVENGYDEFNVQIPAEYKYVFPQQIMLGQENVAVYVPEIKLRSNSIYIKHKPSETYPDQLRIGQSMTIRTRTNQARSLRNYRTCTLYGRYVATELEPSSVVT